jgi:guanylate kinase
VSDAEPPAAGARLVVLSGPGGVGKGTVVRALRARYPELAVSVSATTRPARPGETDGTHYHFLSGEQFERLVVDGGFLEWAEFAGNRYGTPWSSIEGLLRAGRTVLLEIEVQGAAQVRERFPGATLIFLAPPSPEALLERLRTRGTDDPERIAERMALARHELAQAPNFDAVVVNDTVDGAVTEIGRILDL